MITGVHAVLFAPEAERARAFFRDTLGLDSVDAGGGWLIFALPPAELAVHPDGGPPRHELFLMCDDLQATVSELTARGVEFSGGIVQAGFGAMTTLQVPGGGELNLYQPRHASALRS